jgi:small subunit ribosomal protein S17
MPRKKKEELEAEGNEAEISQEETAEQVTDNAAANDAQSGEGAEETSIFESVLTTVSSVASGVAEAVTGGVSAITSAVSDDSATTAETNKSHHSKRAEKIGIVQSDKMTKTVTVRVDRVVKHPVYRKYIKRRKKFMAHDELGATVGDKVRIMETRPLSARKRWRVVEIVQKAVK